MPAISADAADTIQLVRELELLDEPSIRLLEHLFNSRVDEELVSSLIKDKEGMVAIALFNLCTQAHTPRVLGYALRFFADLVCADCALAAQLGRADLFHPSGSSPAATFLQFVSAHHDNLGIINPALYLTSIALRFGEYAENKEAFAAFFAYVRTAFSPDILQVSDIEFVVRACVQIAHRKEYRELFFKEDLISCIPRLLTDIVSPESATIIQTIYETLLLTWMLSFEYEGIVQLVQIKMIPQLHRVLQRVQKEKCVRVALMTLWNMVEAERKYTAHILNPSMQEWVDSRITALSRLQVHNVTGGDNAGVTSNLRKGPSLVAEMVSVGMLKALTQLVRRKFGDEDINELVQALITALESSMEVLTSFSEYRGEVLTGVLEWTPVHTSSKFWHENALKFEDGNYEVLIALGKAIMETHNDTTLAVACHDLGEVVRYHPSGRNLLTLPSLVGVKERVMSLMSSPNPEVAKEALLCTQKIMVQRWALIARS